MGKWKTFYSGFKDQTSYTFLCFFRGTTFLFSCGVWETFPYIGWCSESLVRLSSSSPSSKDYPNHRRVPSSQVCISIIVIQLSILIAVFFSDFLDFSVQIFIPTHYLLFTWTRASFLSPKTTTVHQIIYASCFVSKF